ARRGAGPGAGPDGAGASPPGLRPGGDREAARGRAGVPPDPRRGAPGPAPAAGLGLRVRHRPVVLRTGNDWARLGSSRVVVRDAKTLTGTPGVLPRLTDRSGARPTR